MDKIIQEKILIIGAASEMAKDTISALKQISQSSKKKTFEIYTLSRGVEIMEDDIHNFYLDVTSELDFIKIKEKFVNFGLEFDTIINFAGVAYAGAVVELNEIDLKKQLDVNLFGLLRIIKYLSPFIKKTPKNTGKLVNISSSSTYGIYPFLSPYSISKASGDILLNTFSLETGVRTVSIRPGAVATKFWDKSVELNERVLKERAFESSCNFEKEKKFMVQNAKHNSLHSLNSIYVGKKIAEIIEKKNPKRVYNIGLDAKFAKMSRFLPQEIVNFIVNSALRYRISKMDNNYDKRDK